MMESAGIMDFNGHHSARLEGTGYFLINSGKSSRSSLSTADIVTIDFDGKLIDGTAAPPMEFPIHAEIYRQRPDVTAIAHTHPRWSTILSIAGVKISPVTMQAAVLGAIRYFPRIASINSRSLAEDMVAALGTHRIISLQSHGIVIAAANIIESFALAVYLEENAHRQFLASQIGTARALSPTEIDVISANLWKPSLLQKVWDYHLGKLRAPPR